ncbi:hypothetical protein VTL71DRAFT_9552 [Oculimacula yallundae]|uniref:Uncharacterized protein n=1 Tax=Oculimacula yallundae TaxID=86028 RepID=A0ABR4BR38_9HELO
MAISCAPNVPEYLTDSAKLVNISKNINTNMFVRWLVADGVSVSQKTFAATLFSMSFDHNDSLVLWLHVLTDALDPTILSVGWIS